MGVCIYYTTYIQARRKQDIKASSLQMYTRYWETRKKLCLYNIIQERLCLLSTKQYHTYIIYTNRGKRQFMLNYSLKNWGIGNTACINRERIKHMVQEQEQKRKRKAI